MNKPFQVFCCYARKDHDYLYELKNHLMSLQREKLIEVKADINISAGTEWEREIGRHLDEADIILLLISSDFIASDYCFNKEMRQALARHKQGNARVIPVIVRPTDWGNMPFNGLQVLPKDAKAVISWQNRDDAWTDMVRDIRKIIDELLVTKSQNRIPRRAILIGAAGGAAIAVFGGSVFVITHQQLQNPPFIYTGHSSIVWGVMWSQDGRRIASCSYDSTAQVWDASDGSNLLLYKGHSSSVNVVAWSPDRKHIASGSDDKTVQIWNSSNGNTELTYQGHSDHVNAVAWSPNGQHILSGSVDSTVQIWNPNNGNMELTYRGHSDWVPSAQWSPDGKHIASGSQDRTVQIWNSSNGNTELTYRGHFETVYTVQWSPDGRRIASGSGDRTVRIWNPSNGNTELTYRGHSDAVRSVAWSPDSQHIASSSGDRTVQVWNPSNGNTELTYRRHSDAVNAAQWSPDGRRIASGSADTTVQVWDVTVAQGLTWPSNWFLSQ